MASSLSYTHLDTQIVPESSWNTQTVAEQTSCARMYDIANIIEKQDFSLFKKAGLPNLPLASGIDLRSLQVGSTSRYCAMRPASTSTPALALASLAPTPVSKTAFMEQTRQRGTRVPTSALSPC